MHFKNIIYYLLSGLLMIIAADTFDCKASSIPGSAPVASSASKSKAKKRNSSSSKNKKKSSNKKSKNKNGKYKRGASSKKSSSKKRKSRNVARTHYTPPPKEVPQNDSLTLHVNDIIVSSIPAHLNPGGLRVNSVKPNKSTRITSISLNENFTYLPVTRGFIDTLTNTAQSALPDSLAGYKVTLSTNGKSLSYYIKHIDKLPEQYRNNPPFVTEVHPVANITKGMKNDIIALWHSHGRYYKNGGWSWQRPFLFQSIEDTYTMSYILPYVVPMLENAGAYVFLPRERDMNPNEVIVDNDTNPEGEVYSQSTYRENNGKNQWIVGEEEGFIYDLPDFRDTENPFENGTYRQVSTVGKKEKPSVAAWYADIPEDGEYAIYVSYKTLPNSSQDAHYTVNYSGGTKEFTVNQTMGGGTWIYLCTVPLEAGYSGDEPVVTLSNVTNGETGTVVTADAVKIGGGMGNIARSPHRSDLLYDPSTPDKTLTDNSLTKDDNDEDDDDDSDEDADDEDVTVTDDDVPDPEPTPTETVPVKKGAAPTFRTSGLPRFLEGARYWLHWAGFPEYVYSPFHGADDYKDDYTGRGHWVNYLAGGSRVLPGKEGLNLPVDLSFALHSDAGKRPDDSVVGTLGIYFTQNGTSYFDGTPRINSRMLTDVVMQNITRDIRAEWEPNWTRRSMWDKSYLEARVPEVPTTLIELMSHQNFGDMQYGLDPDFRFTVGRAIYKGLARFLAERKGRDLVIQPLPVQDFCIKRQKKGHYRLSWEPTPDKLEPTAIPNRYVIYERSGEDLGFHRVAETQNTHFDVMVNDNEIHSFYIIASNNGGVSFPSETLALREASDGSSPTLIINGFNRISGPGHFSANGQAGFNSDVDFGVPYIKDISFTGYQTEFHRSAGESFGRSGNNYVNKVIAGNTFDYPRVHGESLSRLGKGFVSSSISAVENGNIKLSDYKTVDIILGKQKTTVTGRGVKKGKRFHVLSDNMKEKLTQFSNKGGRLILTGEFISSDLQNEMSSSEDRKFAQNVLGITNSESDYSKSGKVTDMQGKRIPYSATLNEKMYIVESPDILTPAEDAEVKTLLKFDNGNTAALAHQFGKGIVIISSIPFESITDPSARDSLMKTFLNQ